MALEGLGRLLIYIGVTIVLIGGLLMLASKVPWLGRLPGDILIRKEGLTVYIPLTTMVIVSVIITLVLNIFFRR